MTNKNLSTETDLIFLLSRVEPENKIIEKAQAIIPDLNWDAFTLLAVKHGVASLIYKNLLKLKDIPKDILFRFNGIYNNCLRSNILMISETDRLLKALSEKGIEVVPLKGSLASEQIFGDIGLYPSGDIDIFVHVGDIGRVRDFLESEGYRLNDRGFDEYRDFFLKELYHISMSNGKYTIEPHWNLFMRYFTTPPEFWWKESIIVSSDGKQYRSLSPEKGILYASFRLFYKGFTPLRFLSLITETIRHYKDEIDWEKLFEYARQYHFENVLRVSMKLSRDFLGSPVPQKYTLINGPRLRMLNSLISKMLLKAEDVHPLNKIFLAFLRDDMKGVCRVLLRRVFPSRGEIASRYRLSQSTGKVAAYYVLNPMMLLLRKHRNRS
jgi:hypothetical protein